MAPEGSRRLSPSYGLHNGVDGRIRSVHDDVGYAGVMTGCFCFSSSGMALRA
jgi:hypothetical protein